MADQSGIKFQAGQLAGQAQAKKDTMMEKAGETAQHAKEQAGGFAQQTGQQLQNAKGQAGGFIQQTGEQIQGMAQGAATTVKNAVGMGDANTTTTTKH